MSLTTSTITGRLPLPNNAPSTMAEAIFRLIGFDTEGVNTLLPFSEVRYRLTVGGELPTGAVLWRNARGVRGTVYEVFARWAERTAEGRMEVKEKSLGYIQLGDAATYRLPDLLDAPAGPLPAYYTAIPVAEWNALSARLSQTEVAIQDLIEGPNGFPPARWTPAFLYNSPTDGWWPRGFNPQVQS